MGSLNKVMLIGNLGKDPELRYTPDGLAILKFSLATTEYFNDKSGNKAEKAVWHNIVVFDKLASTMANYLSKGKQIFVEGRINNRSYDDADGNKKYISEIIASNIVLLGKKEDTQSGQQEDYYDEKPPQQTQRATQRPQTQSGQKYQAPPPSAGDEDDIPFD
jgi:single-strand DNA-binding protein